MGFQTASFPDNRRRLMPSLVAVAWLATGFACPGLAASPVPAQPRAVTLNATLASPWGLAFLPDGRMLVTQKGGSMVVLGADGATVHATVSGLPAVAAAGQGGLLDVALDPDFATDPWVYWTYAEQGTGSYQLVSGTAVARGRLVGTALQDVTVIYRQHKAYGNGHFGSRLAFAPDKSMFVTLGERQMGSPAQVLTSNLGKVIRINRDGTVPADNPAIVGALPEIWSYGHRNPQGAAIRPGTSELWLNEHGPQGGDELNRIVAGGNYGWPLVSYGCNYGDPVGDACRIGGGVHAPAYVEPVSYWVPTSIAPAGLVFYTGAGFPQWQGNALIGSLAGTALWRVELGGNAEVARERLFGALGERIRDVEQGPDGWIYLLTDSGKLIRVVQDTYAIATAAAPVAGGSVACTPNPVSLGGTSSCTAMPNPGYDFTGWSGDCTGAACVLEGVTSPRSVTATFAPASTPPRLGNLSTRGRVLTGNDVLIGGFVIGGSAAKTVLIRARGPSMIPAGVTDALADPTMTLVNQATGTIIGTNDNWGTASNASAVTATGLAPTIALESAILTSLAPGTYTVVVSGVNNGVGVGIVEVFEVDGAQIPLLNISTRGQVQTGNNVMIGGFVVDGSGPQQVLIRVRGPSMIILGLANTLADPTMALVNQATGAVIATNDNWGTASNADAITATGLAPEFALESAILTTLAPGAYTVVVSGVNNGTGVGIVEVFAQ